MSKQTAKHNAVNKAADLEGCSVSQAAFTQSQRASAVHFAPTSSWGPALFKANQDKRAIRPA